MRRATRHDGQGESSDSHEGHESGLWMNGLVKLDTDQHHRESVKCDATRGLGSSRYGRTEQVRQSPMEVGQVRTRKDDVSFRWDVRGQARGQRNAAARGNALAW